MSVEDAYDYASEVMTDNMMAEDVGEGIDGLLKSAKQYGEVASSHINN